MEYLKQELEKIKENGRSFLGIDGGNIKVPIWFCGIEFGGDLTEMEKYYKSTIKYNPIKEFDISIPFRENAGDFEKSTYDRYLSAMYINLFKMKKLSNGYDTKPIEKVLREELYNKNSKIFKLNLYPLAKKSTEWDRTIESKLGIPKETYYKDIFTKRQLFLKELVYKFKPKTIICTSTNEYRDEFIEAFLNENEIINFKWIYLNYKNKKFKISEYKTDMTTLIIIPFLGRGNLSSYLDVIFMADYLRDNYFKSI